MTTRVRSRVLTAKQLVALGACHDQVALFRKTFGASVRVTPARMVKVAPLFDWEWGAWQLLSTQARAAYVAATAPAWAAYDATTVPALAACEAATAQAWAAYKAATAQAWAVAYCNDKQVKE